MKREDLKAGMFFETMKGTIYSVDDNSTTYCECGKRKEHISVTPSYHIPDIGNLCFYNDDLTYDGDNRGLDIIKVYDCDFNLIWRREDYVDEEVVLELLVKAWNSFLKLEQQHPNEREYFADGLHKCQSIIAMRYARNYRPDLFPIKTLNKED